MRVFRIAAVVALVLVGSIAACGPRSSAPPSIAFSTVPEAIEGGPGATAALAGRVVGARPGQRLVLFAKSGTWWVQPTVKEPLTPIGADGTWTIQSHFGTHYGALLVEADYVPPTTIDVLPPVGGPIFATASVAGAVSARGRPKLVQFSGYEWEVRQSVSERGGSQNHNDPANAWVDAAGVMHMRLAPRGEGWSSAEVTLTRSLGYGTYLFVVRDTSTLEPAAVFSMFTWDPTSADPTHRELDVEITQWGDPASKNAQFVVQPYYVPANVLRFTAPAGVLTHSMQWSPGRAAFRTVRGAAPRGGGRPVAEHTFTAGVPLPGGEAIRMSLYVFGHATVQLRTGAEVVIEKFVYLP